MTNATIIMNESIRLMKEGILHGCGQFVEVENEDGTREMMELPEEIHTFNGWKALGYSVKKGEKSRIKFPIWKHTTKTVEKDGKEEERSSMFQKVSAFFTFDQVEPITAKA